MLKPSPSLISKRPHGYSLIEVMIAVTLTLFLMYAIAAIFGRVSSIMSQTQDILSMTNNLRSTKDRLISDLENLSVPKLKAPSSKYGFFSYAEGVGNGFGSLNYVFSPGADLIRFSRPDGNAGNYETYGNFDHRNVEPDTTVGDTDDILSFTVRAPAGKWFRGRVFKEKYDIEARFDDNIEIIESEYAEVIWFLRGTTLYRRVLLIVPDSILRNRLDALDAYLGREANDIRPSKGYGFYRFFDISVHYDEEEGRITANTLHDLSNRKNRYGYWSSPVIGQNSRDNNNFVYNGTAIADLGLHGRYNAWYWLRIPTMQESAVHSFDDPNLNSFNGFCAGYPFGSIRPLFSQEENAGSGDLYQNDPVLPLEYWYGSHILLGLANIGPKQNKDAEITSSSLPIGSGRNSNACFIDNWRLPNPWRQQAQISGQLDLSDSDMLVEEKEFNSDVILTNVLSFDVKVWNPESSEFVNLGEQLSYRDEYNNVFYTDSDDFRSEGDYGYRAVNELKPLLNPSTDQQLGTYYYRPIMPAVFDTWTEDYEKEFLAQCWYDQSGNPVFGAASRSGYTLADIPLDDSITALDLPDYPPPYEREIKALQVELRTFDPVSRTIKNATVQVSFE